KQIKKDEINQPFYHFHWGRIYAAQHKTGEAEKRYLTTLDLIALRPDLYTTFIEEFRRVGEPELAKKVVLIARETTKNGNLFRLELAGLYQELAETENMVRRLLSYGTVLSNQDISQSLFEGLLHSV